MLRNTTLPQRSSVRQQPANHDWLQLYKRVFFFWWWQRSHGNCTIICYACDDVALIRVVTMSIPHQQQLITSTWTAKLKEKITLMITFKLFVWETTATIEMPYVILLDALFWLVVQNGSLNKLWHFERNAFVNCHCTGMKVEAKNIMQLLQLAGLALTTKNVKNNLHIQSNLLTTTMFITSPHDSVKVVLFAVAVIVTKPHNVMVD